MSAPVLAAVDVLEHIPVTEQMRADPAFATYIPMAEAWGEWVTAQRIHARETVRHVVESIASLQGLGRNMLRYFNYLQINDYVGATLLQEKLMTDVEEQLESAKQLSAE